MDELGDRMKLYEQAEAGRRVTPLLPICIRLDGRGFSQWTRGLARPFDARLSDLMVETTRKLVEETGALVGFTQSDEIDAAFVDFHLQAVEIVVPFVHFFCQVIIPLK